MFSLAQVADPHVSPLPQPTPLQLCNKRVLGYLSWTLRRKHVHRKDVLAALTTDLVAAAPDHVAVVGDLTNISLPAEFPPALEWLQGLGDPDRVSVVPGNHDTYVALPWEGTIALWRSYMRGDDQPDGRTPRGAEDYPWVRVRDSVAVIGVSTAVPTLPFLATGIVGKAQLARLEALLLEHGRAGRFRVVLIHHPPIDGLTKWRKRLTDSRAFARVIARAGAELILHGHTHEATIASLVGPEAPVPVVGVTSASSNGGDDPSLRSRYNIFRIARGGSHWNIELEVRGLQADGSFGAIERAPLPVGRARA
jgi:3',5'-cyclic AMP phosphodiesterase CpdA